MSNSEFTAKAAVFWDIEDYKIPNGLNAGLVSENIKTALADMGFHGTVSVHAYADETNQIQEDDFDPAGIKLIHVKEGLKGKDRARELAILNGILSWVLGNGKEPLTVMVISDNNFFDITVNNLKAKNHNAILTSLSAEGKPIAHTIPQSRGSSLCPKCQSKC